MKKYETLREFYEQYQGIIYILGKEYSTKEALKFWSKEQQECPARLNLGVIEYQKPDGKWEDSYHMTVKFIDKAFKFENKEMLASHFDRKCKDAFGSKDK